jgi:hypothetical protein
VKPRRRPAPRPRTPSSPGGRHDRHANRSPNRQPDGADDRRSGRRDCARGASGDDGRPLRGARDRSTDRLSTSDIAAGNDDATATGTGRSATDSAIPDAKVAPLFSEDDATRLRDRWTDVQAGFVDEPRTSVEQADSLVAEVMKRLADSFSTERQSLERQWSSGEQASTEDLRVALRRYRSFFDRLLSV